MVKLFQYLDATANFDCDAYKSIQIAGNKEKIGNVWTAYDNFHFLADWLRKIISPLAPGICHGIRRGLEQRRFRETLNIDFVGTETSDNARDREHAHCAYAPLSSRPTASPGQDADQAWNDDGHN